MVISKAIFKRKQKFGWFFTEPESGLKGKKVFMENIPKTRLLILPLVCYSLGFRFMGH